MSKKKPNSLWTKHRRGRQGKMAEIAGTAYNRTLMERDSIDSIDYCALFRHQRVIKGRFYHRGAFIRHV